MPSSITHQLVAEETLKRLPQETAQLIIKAPDEYYLGAQGPDMLFFYRIGGRKEYNLGKFMHRYRIFDTFGYFLRALTPSDDGRVPRFSKEEQTQARAYVLGFITHYCTDSAFHPFVYHYLEKTGGKKFAHQQIENDWDVYFLRKLRGRENERFTYNFSPAAINGHKTVARLYHYLTNCLEREEAAPRKVNSGVKNFDRYLRFFHGKCYRSQRAWERMEKLFHTKKFLSALYPRKNPDPDIIEREDFSELAAGRGKNADELFCSAVNESVRLIKLFLAADETPLTREDFGRGLLTGEIL